MATKEPQPVTEDQLSVQGQVQVVNNPEPEVLSLLRQTFRDLHFPATKSQIMKYLGFDGNSEILSMLQSIEDKQYINESEVALAAGLVS
jgi:hypothetical protein